MRLVLRSDKQAKNLEKLTDKLLERTCCLEVTSSPDAQFATYAPFALTKNAQLL